MNIKIQSSKNIWTNGVGIFAIIVIFHSINNLLWFRKDGYIQQGCHSVWLEEKSFIYGAILSDKSISLPHKVSKTMDFFKPKRNNYIFSATNFSLASFFVAFPISTSLKGHIKLFLINCILFLQFLLVLFAIYYLGKFVFNQNVGAWSATIFSFYPGVVGLSRKLNSELMVTFFIILSAILFLNWEKLSKILRVGLLFATFILGTFSGGLFLVFFISLFLLHFLSTSLTYKKKKETLIQFFIFLCLILLFFSFYFNGEHIRIFSNLKEGLDEAYQKLFLQSRNFIGSADNAIIESFLFAPQDSVCPCTQTINVGMNIRTFLFYIMEMVYYASPLFFLLAFYSFFFLLKDKGIVFYKRIFLGIWVFFGYLLLSLFHIKWGKFITPGLPVLALSTGVFISDSRKNSMIRKMAFFLGIFTVVYYSYFSVPQERFLEKINEGIISHHPLKSRFVSIAEHIATRINNKATDIKGRAVNIAFLDKESPRFRHRWYADQSAKVYNLTQLFLSKNVQVKNFWRLTDEFYYFLSRQDFIILITQKELGGIKDYLYPEETKRAPNLNFEIVYEDSLGENTFIYLTKISKVRHGEN